MIEIEIPGFRLLRLAHLALDDNGTLAVNGDLIDGVESCLAVLAGELNMSAPFVRTDKLVVG